VGGATRGRGFSGSASAAHFNCRGPLLSFSLVQDASNIKGTVQHITAAVE